MPQPSVVVDELMEALSLTYEQLKKLQFSKARNREFACALSGIGDARRWLHVWTADHEHCDAKKG